MKKEPQRTQTTELQSLLRIQEPEYAPIPTEPEEDVPRETTEGMPDGWSVDPQTNQIKAAPGAKVISVNQLYSAIQDHFDDFDMLAFSSPMLAVTPEAITMENDWSIDDVGMKKLHGGSIQQNGEWYSSQVVPGAVPVSKKHGDNT